MTEADFEDLNHEDDLRAELARQARLLAPDDQARLLRLIEAMQGGVAIDGGLIRDLDPAELRQWADGLGERKD